MARIETPARTRDTSRSVGSGAVAGIVGALVLALFAMIVFAARGQGFFTPLELMGATFVGDTEAYGLGAFLIGSVIHLSLGAMFGAFFGFFVASIRSPGVRLAAGLAYGAVIFLFMTYLVIPWADPILAAAIEPGWFFLYHLAFGLTLPLFTDMRHPRVVARHLTRRSDSLTTERRQ